MNQHIDLARLHIADLLAEAERERLAALARPRGDSAQEGLSVHRIRLVSIAAVIALAVALADKLGSGVA